MDKLSFREIDAHQSACMITPLLAFADSCFEPFRPYLLAIER